RGRGGGDRDGEPPARNSGLAVCQPATEIASTWAPAGAITNPSVAAGVLKWRASPRFAEYTTDPDEKSSAYSRPVSGSIAQTAPAAMIGEPSRGDGAFHAMLNEVWLTDSATRPSAHGTSIIGPDQAVPPHAPAQTFA